MMAESVASQRKLEWKKSTEMDSPDDSDAYVPGVNSLGNFRPKLQARRSLEAKAKLPAKSSSVEESQSSAVLSVQELSQSLDELKLHSTGNKRTKVSLKDLCVEDKQRIANLIKELARVGEEREKAREELEKERNQYEQQILALVQQQEVILKERQEVEKHLMICQNLLMQCQMQRASLPAAPLPHLTQFQGVPDPLFGSLGAPHGNIHPPVTPYIGQEIAMQRLPQVFVSGPGCQSHFSHPIVPGTVSPHLAHGGNNLLAAVDLQPQDPQQQCAVHPPSAAEYNQPDAQAPHSGSAMLGQGIGLKNNLHMSSLHGNKEEIMKRFLASQLPEKDMAPHSVAHKQPPDRQNHQRSPKKTLKHTPFLPPRMSSTHKSTEIGEFLSVDTLASHHDFAPLAPNDSPESFGRDDEDMVEGGCEHHQIVVQKKPEQGRVMFTDVQGLGKHHSPHGDGGDDKCHVHTYHKLTQVERKQQLLQQRAQLLEEQKRLKQILSEQEAMLKEKQQALYLRSNDGVNYGSNRDPQDLVPQRIAIDAALERQRAMLECMEAQSKQHASPKLLDPSGQNEEYLKEQLASSKRLAPLHGQTANNHGNTFTVHPNTMSDIARKLDYSLLSDQEVVRQSTPHDQLQDQASSVSSDEKSDDGSGGNMDRYADGQDDDSNESDDAVPQRVDAGTSLSYCHIPRHVRPASTPQEQVIHTGDWEGRAISAALPLTTQRSQTPGEKTMTVLEIVNSQTEGPTFHRHKPHRFFPSAHGQSQFSHLAGLHQDTSLFRQQNQDLHISGRRRDSDGGDVLITDVSSEENSNADAEESQILEDIFFVK